MRKATGHFFSRFQNEGVWPRRDAFCHAVAGIVDASELAHLRQRVTEKREVLLLAQLTNQTNLIQRFFVVQTANQPVSVETAATCPFVRSFAACSMR